MNIIYYQLLKLLHPTNHDTSTLFFTSDWPDLGPLLCDHLRRKWAPQLGKPKDQLAIITGKVYVYNYMILSELTYCVYIYTYAYAYTYAYTYTYTYSGGNRSDFSKSLATKDPLKNGLLASCQRTFISEFPGYSSDMDLKLSYYLNHWIPRILQTMFFQEIFPIFLSSMSTNESQAT